MEKKFVPFSIGADPEMFIQDTEDNWVSSIGLVEGTKKKPERLERGTFLMKDNVAVEFGMEPARTQTQWVSTLVDSYKQVEDYLPEHLKLALVPSAIFPANLLDSLEACEFGCEPDYNAWTREVNDAPQPPEEGFRSCGAHIHVGSVCNKTAWLHTVRGKTVFIRLMDAYHGAVATLLDDSAEAKARRGLYGKAGAYRPTDYGIEYRVLSNFWLKNKTFMKLMYNLTAEAVTNMTNRALKMEKMVGMNGPKIQKIINDGAVGEASRWLLSISKQWNESTLNIYKLALKEK